MILIDGGKAEWMKFSTLPWLFWMEVNPPGRANMDSFDSVMKNNAVIQVIIVAKRSFVEIPKDANIFLLFREDYNEAWNSENKGLAVT